MSKYDYKQTEEIYQKEWNKKQIYAYDPISQRKTFVIDTPPPTVSGSLHIGHIFSYTQTDILARFHRMTGKNVFYPMGWDDNGLPTEKRIHNVYAVKCDPKLDYDPHFKPEKTNKKQRSYQSISRKNFLEICNKQVLEDENKYKKLWNHIALSVDWNQSYRTIDTYTQTLAQLSFLDLYQKHLVENRFSPVLWDTQFQTAVAQADIEDKEQKGFYYDIPFHINGSLEFTISTTRPELLPACVAVSAHPEDHRYQKLFGKTAISPLFHRSVPIIPSPHADPEKGTGLLMICTFGDMEDVAFCKKHKLPILQIIDDEGFFMNIPFDKGLFKSQKIQEASLNYSHLKGLRVKQARKKIVELLHEKQYLKTQPKECLQYVKYYEKGDFPLEILPKRQWYIKILDQKEELLKQGGKIQWHPAEMRKRYEQWVEGLNQDWCISRQRQYGVPFPVWYKIDEKGQADYKNPLIPYIKNPLKETFSDAKFSPTADELVKNFISINKISFPIDPLKQSPEDFKEEQRNKAKGFIADTDVMDTWATSSLSPYINSGWLLNQKKHKRLFPADVRPQAHEIIRTWAFYTIVKAYFHEKTIPWKNIAISGWVVTPEKRKMSKSKGNALTPENLIDTYSADAVRYWAAKARLGQDTVYDENLFQIGKKLTTKIFNASRFVQIQLEGLPFVQLEDGLKDITVPIDQAWVKQLLNTKIQAIDKLQNYDHKGALDCIEKSFWAFCDNYLELIKARVYQMTELPEGLSGKRALDYSLHTFLKLFAPYLPYITEAVWSIRYKGESSSLHSSLWLEKSTLKQIEKKLDLILLNKQTQRPSFIKSLFSLGKIQKKTTSLDRQSLLENAFTILEQIRSKKSQLNKSLASPLENLKLTANSDHIKEFEFYKEDIARAAHVDPNNILMIEQNNKEQPEVTITLKA